jgi:hypothetical protein
MHFHASEFENHERPAPEANTFLSIENGTGRRNFDRGHDEEHKRQPNRPGHGYQHEVESSLPARRSHQNLTGRFRGLARGNLSCGGWYLCPRYRNQTLCKTILPGGALGSKTLNKRVP